MKMIAVDGFKERGVVQLRAWFLAGAEVKGSWRKGLQGE